YALATATLPRDDRPRPPPPPARTLHAGNPADTAVHRQEERRLSRQTPAGLLSHVQREQLRQQHRRSRDRHPRPSREEGIRPRRWERSGGRDRRRRGSAGQVREKWSVVSRSLLMTDD